MASYWECFNKSKALGSFFRRNTWPENQHCIAVRGDQVVFPEFLVNKLDSNKRIKGNDFVLTIVVDENEIKVYYKSINDYPSMDQLWELDPNRWEMSNL